MLSLSLDPYKKLNSSRIDNGYNYTIIQVKPEMTEGEFESWFKREMNSNGK